MTITFTARTFGMVGAALLSVLAVLAPHHLAATAARAQTPTANVRDSQAVDEIDLTAGPVKWEIQPRLVVDGWGYNGQVPGPELHVREGDLVRVKLHNKLPAPT